MINYIIIGVWACVVTLAGAYGGMMLKGGTEEPAKEGPKAELVAVKGITVPIVNKDGVEGYLIAAMSYNLDREKLTESDIDVALVLRDETFRTLYGVDAVKYRKPRKSDLVEISKELVASLNHRLGEGSIKEVLIEELSFIPKEEARAGRTE